MKILLIGREGQVAWELRRTLACLGEVVALDRHSHPLAVDLADAASLRAACAEVKPDLIVNAAAYTAVDRAEGDQALAYAVNAVAPGVLAEQAKALNAGLIHYSTDYVFPGDVHEPHRETDATGPQSVYGRSKLAGETAIAQVGASHVILRTAWVYGMRGHNFLLTMLRLMKEREVLRVVNDQFGAPTWSRLIAEATALLIAQASEGERFATGGRDGIYHLSCAGQTSWHDFAQAIRERGIAQGLLSDNCARLEAISSAEYPTPARRPAYSVLSNDRLSAHYGLRLPDWREALALCLDGAKE
ncbi:dTDP-4-dehydrorhamnose reductase [Methylococcus sp. EFPC2]|nr:dTDP-4-dehydrorhamnose reductase [Methylococcus sp. EFPC2]